MPKQQTRGIYIAGVVLLAVFVLYIVSTAQRNHRLRLKEDPSVLPTTVKFGGELLPGAVFRGMETARYEKSSELIAEIKKVIDQKNTPSDIFKNNISEKTNIAITLNECFHGYEDQPGDLQILRNAAPKGDEWGVDQETLTNLAEILSRFEPKRLTIRQMLNKPDTHFYFIFHQDRDAGEIVDSDAADYLEDYLLLEEYAIGQAILNGDIVESLNSLVYIFRIAQLAAEVGLPAVRSEAALIRLRALDIMQTIVLDPKFSKRYLIGVYEMLREQLVHWTPENTVWIADRASGIKAYHRILQSGLEGALAPEEIQELEKRNLVIGLQKKKNSKRKNKSDSNDNGEPEIIEEALFLNNNFLVNHVADEVFYLKSMQTVIDESPKPFYRRLLALNDINNAILEKTDKVDEPIIAGLLLRGIVPLMRLYAQDRAGCEIAFEAMAVSLEKPAIMSLTSNPFSADSYEVKKIQDTKNPNRSLIQVSSPGNRKPFCVPEYRIPK